MAILYICNGERCENCSEECKHTSDIANAANYKAEPTETEKSLYFTKDEAGNFWEQ